MKWSADQFQALKGLVDRGLSASQIGAEMGVTRNAVIGKAHRGGLALSTKPVTAPQQPRRRRPRQCRVAKNSNGSRPPGLTELPPEIVAAPVTLHELTQEHCRWPVGTIDHMLYCGAAHVAGSPYCARHDWIAHHGGAA